MIKKLIKDIPLLLATLPQIIFNNYGWIIAITILVGFSSAFLIENRNIFRKIICYQFIVFSIVFLFEKENIYYIDMIFDNFSLPKLLSSIIFILFNLLNIVVLFYSGRSVYYIIFDTYNLFNKN
ncbi:hypothetical protein [Tenacibaculum sp. C7A-26P2]|uniref:hypothetical protein n=1 Tax=Tenacibaculum sp. C7A-26P2 TaxID=3447504 RepID=UPI003F8800D4